MLTSNPYPVTGSIQGLNPTTYVNYHDTRPRIQKLNQNDPQPPGYAYRLPMSAEYDDWARNRDLVVPEEAYRLGNWGFGTPLPSPAKQAISYYEAGLWHHVGGSVDCWCGDPRTAAGTRVLRGGSWLCDPAQVQKASPSQKIESFTSAYTGYRLVRGPRS